MSIKSAIEVSRNLDAEKYSPIYVLVGRDGRWQQVDSPEKQPQGHTTVVPSTDRKNKGLIVLKDGQYETLPIDVAFALLHGKYGEDGTVQGILEMSHIPYVGCGIAPSALCMDKALTYLVAAGAGVNVPRHKVIHESDEITAGDLQYPVFVKPARSGSSFGVNKASEPSALANAVRAAFVYDSKVLLEEAVLGSEIGCSVMGNEERLFTGALDQITLSGGFFRIHQEAKPEQGSENATICVPAPISEELRRLVLETATTVYRALGCCGLARVDLFVTPSGKIVLNEVNTMPGFASYSRYPRMMEAAGVPLGEVIDRLIAFALEKGGNRP